MGENDERSAAEDYRRQRQQADARRSGFESTDPNEVHRRIAENNKLLHELAKANSSADDNVSSLVEEYKQVLINAPPGSTYDDLHYRVILHRIISEIESACISSQVPIRNGVVYGVSPEMGAVISQANVPTTEVSIIAVSLPFIPFCNRISKAMARTLPHRAVDHEHVEVSMDPARVRTQLKSSPEICAEWAWTLAHYAAFGWHPSSLSPIPQRRALVSRVQLLRSIELFAIGHEYGHHVMRHGVLQSSDDHEHQLMQEHEADIFARAVSMAIGSNETPPNLYAISGAGAVVLLGALDLVRRTRSVLRTGTDESAPSESHPPYLSRVEAIAALDQNLPDGMKPASVDMRACFISIMEIVWEIVKPAIEDVRATGVRPLEDLPETGGWLP